VHSGWSGEQLTPSVGSAPSLVAPLAKRPHRCGYCDRPLRWPLCSRRLEGAASSSQAMSSGLSARGRWPSAWNPPVRNPEDFPLVMAESLRSGRSEGPVRTDDESSSHGLTTCVPRQLERHCGSSPRRLQHPGHCGGSRAVSLCSRAQPREQDTPRWSRENYASASSSEGLASSRLTRFEKIRQRSLNGLHK